MKIVLNAVITLVALLHLGFLALEMFLWAKPLGLKIFAHSLENAKKTEILAANQGLYNGFLAAGLFWGLIHPSEEFARQIQYFFLICIFLAGIYGGASANKKIILIQALPAAVALLLLLIVKN